MRALEPQALVRWLDAPGATVTSIVGGKAASLSRLAAVHQVPPGFVVTTHAFASARDAAPEEPAPRVPERVRSEIAAAYEALSRRSGDAPASVAVRSSAVDEDGAHASFAGQHETYLNVVGADAVVEAVERCWASAVTERALAYRRQHGLTIDGVRLAVLVQLLVSADVAAVVFSANPLTGARDEVVVNASWGLGESIVGGTVTPDAYVVRKRDLAVTGRLIADKRRMTVSVPDGSREVDVPRFMRGQPALNDRSAAALARLAIDLEAATGWPVDVECAFQGESLYLLQCRPITTLASTHERKEIAA
jgi:pyruvate,water dikinase